MRRVEAPDNSVAWQRLHERQRFRPAYPSESVVRFVAGRLAEPRSGAGRIIADLGCGAGRHTRLVSELGGIGVGIDMSFCGERHASSLDPASRTTFYSVGLLQALPLPDRSVGAAIAYGSLYYGDEIAYRASVAEVWRVLVRGGELFVVTRTTADRRTKLGTPLGERTVRIVDDLTNEAGMTMHFLDRDAVCSMFADFAEIIVDYEERTIDGGPEVDSDWLIRARK
jgi:SAM-dependent methyltransferase